MREYPADIGERIPTPSSPFTAERIPTPADFSVYVCLRDVLPHSVVREYPADPLLPVVREYPADSPPRVRSCLGSSNPVDCYRAHKMAFSMENLRVRLQARHVAQAGVAAVPVATHPATAMGRSMNGVLAQSIIQIRRAQGTVPLAKAKPAASPTPDFGSGAGASYSSHLGMLACSMQYFGCGTQGGIAAPVVNPILDISDEEGASSGSESDLSHCPLLTAGSKCSKLTRKSWLKRKRFTKKPTLEPSSLVTEICMSEQAEAIDNSKPVQKELIKCGRTARIKRAKVSVRKGKAVRITAQTTKANWTTSRRTRTRSKNYRLPSWHLVHFRAYDPVGAGG